MAVPKKRLTKRRRNNRRKAPGHQQVHLKHFAKCVNCSALVMPHRVCANCGYYKGKKILSKLANVG
jgi:large subunit ribosomal protein L32